MHCQSNFIVCLTSSLWNTCNMWQGPKPSLCLLMIGPFFCMAGRGWDPPGRMGEPNGAEAGHVYCRQRGWMVGRQEGKGWSLLKFSLKNTPIPRDSHMHLSPGLFPLQVSSPLSKLYILQSKNRTFLALLGCSQPIWGTAATWIQISILRKQHPVLMQKKRQIQRRHDTRHEAADCQELFHQLEQQQFLSWAIG